MKRYYIIFIIIFAFQNIQCQTGFKEGFIITNDNDTIKGFINNRGYYKNSQNCVFESANISEIVEYLPFEIKGYRLIGDKFYISKEIKIDNENEKIFAEYLVDGIVNLYYYRNKNGKDRYYLEKKGDYFIELTNEKEELLKNGTIYNRYSNKYISLLKAAFKDCQIIQPELSAVKLSHNSLSNIVEKYHKYTCEYECVVYKKKIPLPKLSYGVSLGLSNKRIHFIEADGNSNISRSIPIYGFLNITVPLTNERLSAQFEIEYDNIHVSNSYFVNTSSMNYFYNGEYIWGDYNLYSNISFKYQTISLPFLVRYEIPLRKIIPFFGFGFAFVRIFNSEVTRSTSILIDNSIEPYLNNKYELNSHTISLLFDIGIEHQLNKKLSLFLKTRYNFYGNKIINDPIEKFYRANSFAVFVGMHF